MLLTPLPQLSLSHPLAAVCLHAVQCFAMCSGCLQPQHGRQAAWGVDAGPSNFQQAAQHHTVAHTPPDATEQLEQHVR
jgi:hypothetical protein